MMYPMYQYPSYRNPYEVQNQSQQIVSVNGMEGAKAYQMYPNSTVALFDSNNDIFYLKKTDGAGFATIRRFKFVEIGEEENKVSSDFEKRLSDLSKEVEELKGVVNGKLNIQQEQ